MSTDQVWLVYKSRIEFEGVEGQFTVGSHIMATASKRVLEVLAEGTKTASSIVAFAGYAGWAPMQLENEIRQGAWLPTDSTWGLSSMSLAIAFGSALLLSSAQHRCRSRHAPWVLRR
ncbi:MAG: YqgE/AlgH family protein [Polyangiaceae bacterium]